jgi:predicted enzyme related to lactoylglutathione lyase
MRRAQPGVSNTSGSDIARSGFVGGGLTNGPKRRYVSSPSHVCGTPTNGPERESSKFRFVLKNEGNFKMADHYLEIVSNDVDTLTALYDRMHGLSFGPPDSDLGQARVATRADGTLVGIRKPLAAHEQPIVRAYLAVDDIQQAVKKAEDSGATIAYPPTRQGQRGTFAIVIQSDVQHGLWQR